MNLIICLPLMSGPRYLFTHYNASSGERREKMRTLSFLRTQGRRANVRIADVPVAPISTSRNP